MNNLITIGLPSKGRLKDKSINFFDKKGFKVLQNKQYPNNEFLINIFENFLKKNGYSVKKT